ncbi:MAG: FecR family protein [Dehalococcoidia bacterium]
MKNASIFKWLSVMLAVLIVAAAIGCGKGGEQQATPTPVPTATSSPTATTPAGESGTLSDIAGDVQVLRSGISAWAAATDGMKIWTGDGLKTGSDGYVLITFFDGSVMEVEADTDISIEELSENSGGSTTVRINQVIGSTINRVQNLVDSSSTYEVETPAGSAVVRGTIEKIQVGLYGRTCTEVVDEEDTEEHSAVFTGMGVAVAIAEGMMSCCEAGGIPGQPFYTDPADDPWQGGDGGGGSYCPPECWEEGSCVCPCCCLSPCYWVAYQGVYIEGEGTPLLSIFQNILVTILNGYTGQCYCPEPTPTYTPPPST